MWINKNTPGRLTAVQTSGPLKQDGRCCFTWHFSAKDVQLLLKNISTFLLSREHLQIAHLHGNCRSFWVCFYLSFSLTAPSFPVLLCQTEFSLKGSINVHLILSCISLNLSDLKWTCRGRERNLCYQSHLTLSRKMNVCCLNIEAC